MDDLLKRLKQLEDEAGADLRKISGKDQLEEFRIKYLGRRGAILGILDQLRRLTPDQKREVGQRANLLKAKLEEAFQELLQKLSVSTAAGQKPGDFFDYTLPGRQYPQAKIHPLTSVTNQILEIFYRLGFELATGPEIETDYYNFEALNIPAWHPARDMQDTFYLENDYLLRTHTSPVQIRSFESRKPPLKILAPGRVYRHEAINVRSYSTFYQVEGFYVDENVTLADLKGTLFAFVKAFYGEQTKARFRPSYFPFTEPSAEVDISCILCQGKGCSLCKQTGWLEILGCGMIHPNVFKNVGYDPEKYTGYAFGLGVDRIALQKLQIPDIRLLYENDIKFLGQF
ncbi:MAG: phenylalanine--tRNA ligase subunit alpha [candidate division Zixibacteria bacterium RBG_16_48_11]|nr:MAG: phenylalanine--tRNA ligase subunit alpha [candidate division Zixibacteria bacterium RBG_16_48_11]